LIDREDQVVAPSTRDLPARLVATRRGNRRKRWTWVEGVIVVVALMLFVGGPVVGISLAQASGESAGSDGMLRSQLAAERDRQAQLKTIVQNAAENLQALEAGTAAVEQQMQGMTAAAQRLQGAAQPSPADAKQLQDNVTALQKQLGQLATAVDRASSSLASVPGVTNNAQSKQAPDQPAAGNSRDDTAQAPATPAAQPTSALPDPRTAEQKKVVQFWPIDAKITTPFGSRPDPNGNGTIFSSGIDIGAAIGTPVKAVQAGKVITVGWQNGYGLAVKIQQEDGWVALYAHNSEVKVNEGDTVQAGQVISLSGGTGPVAGGPHLHFQLSKDGNAVDPMPYLPPSQHQN
jgi:murein DD-endopeptidase MepM/ murein hydrolase activator NlpD